VDAQFVIHCVVRQFVYLAPSSEFRVFVVAGKITAASQYIDCLFFPELDVEQVRASLLQFQEQGDEEMCLCDCIHFLCKKCC
jgi:hypothetical protein